METIYHTYNRGAHKAVIFQEKSDYRHFMQLLYIANTKKAFRLRNINPKDRFAWSRGEILVEIIAYCLMPNHYHVLFREIEPGNKKIFMEKLCTAYSNYYNLKYRHSGTIYQGSCKSKFVGDDDYLSTVIKYIHLNPYGIEEPDLTKEAKKEYLTQAWEYSIKYEYSSLQDYAGRDRLEGAILTPRETLGTEGLPRQ